MVGMTAKSSCSHPENPRGNGGKGEMGDRSTRAFPHFSPFPHVGEGAVRHATSHVTRRDAGR
jgi:hypothetical protein